MRQRMQEVMRYAGPRMLWHHPVTAIAICGASWSKIILGGFLFECQG